MRRTTEASNRPASSRRGHQSLGAAASDQSTSRRGHRTRLPAPHTPAEPRRRPPGRSGGPRNNCRPRSWRSETGCGSAYCKQQAVVMKYFWEGECGLIVPTSRAGTRVCSNCRACIYLYRLAYTSSSAAKPASKEQAKYSYTHIYTNWVLLLSSPSFFWWRLYGWCCCFLFRCLPFLSPTDLFSLLNLFFSSLRSKYKVGLFHAYSASSYNILTCMTYMKNALSSQTCVAKRPVRLLLSFFSQARLFFWRWSRLFWLQLYLKHSRPCLVFWKTLPTVSSSFFWAAHCLKRSK